jgi:hypothetical protein
LPVWGVAPPLLPLALPFPLPLPLPFCWFSGGVVSVGVVSGGVVSVGVVSGGTVSGGMVSVGVVSVGEALGHGVAQLAVHVLGQAVDGARYGGERVLLDVIAGAGVVVLLGVVVAALDLGQALVELGDRGARQLGPFGLVGAAAAGQGEQGGRQEGDEEVSESQGHCPK